jgi:hypothetical protein
MKDYHKSALAETSLIILFTIMPTLFGVMKIFFSTHPSDCWSSLYKSGEFFLYAVSLLGSSFLVYNHYKIKKSDLLSLFSILTIILILIFSFCYTGIANIQSPDIYRIKIASIVAIIISVPIFYYSQVINNKHSPDIGAQRRSEQETIENALN